MRSFNELIEAKGYPVNPVRHAVVLFTVKSDKTASNFNSLGFYLHGLLSFGRQEMAELNQETVKSVIKKVDTFKRGFGCESSVRLNA
jgi:hypothetical protein